MSEAFLVTRPNHDIATNFLACWSQNLIDLAKNKKFLVHDLFSKKANKKNFSSHLKSGKPSFIFLNGHGSANLVAGYDDKPILECETNKNLPKNSLIYARSCMSAHTLGPFLVKNGLKTFVGHQRNFMIMYYDEFITKPLKDPLAKLFLEPSNLLVKALIKGNSASIALKRSQKAMQKNISKCLASSAKKTEKDAVMSLWWNMKSLVLIGNEGTLVT